MSRGRSSSKAFDESYAAEPHALAEIGRDLAAFLLRAGVAPSQRARATSATLELVENAAQHAYAPGSSAHVRRVHVSAVLEGASLRVGVRDQGRGFAPRDDALESLPAPLPTSPGAITERRAAGGLSRARALAEDLQISSDGRGTSATLVFELRPIQFEEESPSAHELDFLAPEAARRLLAAGVSGAHEPLLDGPSQLTCTIGRLLAADRDPFASAHPRGC